MAASRTMSASPLKGVNRAFSRTQQPSDTCYDALNILPVDRYQRLRVAQRQGTTRLWSSAIGSGSQTVQLLQQTTLALDPSTITANTLLLNEPFTYSDGNLQTVATTAVWKTYTASSGVQAAARFSVTTNNVEGDGTAGLAVYQPTLVIGSAYVIKVNLVFNTVTAAAGFAIGCRLHSTTPDGTIGIYLKVTVSAAGAATLVLTDNASGSTGFTSSGTWTSAAGFITAGITKTLELHVNGDLFQGFIDSIPLVSGSSATDVANSNVGFWSGNTTASFDDFKVYTGTALSSYRQTDIIAVSGGKIYIGDIDTQGTTVTGSSSPVLSTTGIPSMAYSAGQAYFVDGVSSIQQLDIVSRTLTTFTPTGAGTTETAATLGQYQLACMWRDRLVLGANRSNPQNFVMSRVGTKTDFDYSQTDAAAAFAGNASTAGRIGDPITCLIPFSEDRLLIGGDHNMWMVEGDPADGGSINMISDSIGILGKDAWCKTPEGVVYFVGTGGLFRMTPGSKIPEPVSLDKYPQFFNQINRGTSYSIMTWDRDRYGCYVFVSPVNSGSATHLWYDARTDGFWPIQFPNAHGPISALVYDGDAPTDRQILLGGRTGFINQLNDSARSDADGADGTAITSYIVLGPFAPFDGQGKLIGATLDFGELNTDDLATAARWNVNAIFQAGATAYEVTQGTPKHISGANVPIQGRSKRFRQRLLGEWFTCKLTNGALAQYFSLERLVMEFVPAGDNKDQGL